MSNDPRTDLEAHDADVLGPLAERLMEQRPVPAAAFRGELRRRLSSTGSSVRRPRLLWLRVSASLASGSLLLAIAALGVAGTGPLAA